MSALIYLDESNLWIEGQFEVHVLYWNHAAVNLKTAADKFQSLNGFLERLRY